MLTDSAADKRIDGSSQDHEGNSLEREGREIDLSVHRIFLPRESREIGFHKLLLILNRLEKPPEGAARVPPRYGTSNYGFIKPIF